MVNFGKVRRAQVAKSTLLTAKLVPLASVQMLKNAKRNGKLPHLFIPSKTTTLVPEFAVEDLPLDRPATLVPALAVKHLPLGRKL